MKRREKDSDFHSYTDPDSLPERMSPQKALCLFLAGLVMLIIGLFILSQKILVYSTFFTSGLYIRGFHLNTGLIVIPLIAGIVWMFVSPKGIGGKLLTAVGALLIIASVIMSTSLHLLSMSLFDWILILVLIFGGGGLILRVLIAR